AIDDAALSTFITPSIVDRDPVVVAIGTEGTSPVLGMGLRSKIEALLPQALGSLAIAASHLRQSVAERVPHGNRRRSFWQRYVFGRGGEEQAALIAEGIPVDVVPGITAALGCASSIGLPLTQRGQNRAFTLLTGASEDGLAQHDWAALAKPGQAFAIYMGVNAAGDISAQL